jgi:polyhydroxyalkanoate synthase
MSTTQDADNDPLTTGKGAQSDAELLQAAFDAIRLYNPVFGPPPSDDRDTIGLGIEHREEPLTIQQIVGAVLTNPTAAVRRSAGLAAETAKIVLGASDIDVSKDRRFRHDQYSSNPLLRRVAQQYLAWRASIHDYVDDLDLNEAANQQGHFLANLLTEAAAPTNILIGNPAAIERAIETRGRSLQRGFINWLRDQANNGGMPSTVDTEPFVLGETTAATPGEVVFRNEVLELIRYTPTTAKVRKRPLFVIPPQINKYYILDLGPGRSLMEATVASGHQVFMVSWRNVTTDHRHWDLDHYVLALNEAMDATMALTNQDKINLLAVCAGGITAAAALGYFQAIGDERINSASFLVTALDWGVPTLLSSMVGGANAGPVTERSRAAGILSGRDLSRLFAWLRPNDLVWNYWVNNYLMGKKPPAFDVLAWNVDSTNLPAGLHGDFMAITSHNTLLEADAVEVLGEKIDLGKVMVDSYVIGGKTDHITPWESCFSTVNMLGGPSNFVLCTSGHVQTMVCPPDNPRATYLTGPPITGTKGKTTPDSWLESATTHNGTWWPDWFTWLKKHSDGLINAPKRLDSDEHPSLGPAPGTYVR